jgi:deazaflavin-dependent oxidoreductase (nitroreductase family)
MRSRSHPMTAYQERLGRFTVQTMTGLNNVVYRLSNGRVAGHVPGGAPICLLTTIGRKSGRDRTVPLLYLPDGDNLVIVASKGGMSTHPSWYLNLLTQPRAVVETGSRRRAVTARAATDDERARMWPQLVAVYRFFAEYQARTDRAIPLVVLEPAVA